MRVKEWALMGILCGTMVLLAGCGKAQKAYKQAVALAENGSYVKAAASFKEAIAENKDKAAQRRRLNRRARVWQSVTNISPPSAIA